MTHMSNRLGALNTLASDRDIASLTNEELLIAHECVGILQSKMRLFLFTRANARAHGYSLPPLVPNGAPLSSTMLIS
jgi:hypothetical protein